MADLVSDLKSEKNLTIISQNSADESYKNPGMRIMEKMGWRAGKGLGRRLQGRLRPVETTPIGIKGNHEGFGLNKRNYEMASDPDKFTNVTWLKNRHCSLPDYTQVRQWEKNRFTSDENSALIGTVFCDDKKLITDLMTLSAALKKTNVAKRASDHLADIKMGNIDIVYNHLFTGAANATGDETLRFVDMSDGSSRNRLGDYLLIKMKGMVKGYGFVTRDSRVMPVKENDRASFTDFSTYHGTDHRGNLCNLNGQLPFRDTIMSETNGKGVHVAMCAGESARKGQDYNDEMSTRQLYICQLYLALKVLCQGGILVMRMGNLYSIFSAGLVYLIYRCFDRMSIFKPATSEPTDAERFVIGQGKKNGTNEIENYLGRVNDMIIGRKRWKDILGLVEFEDLVGDVEFREYLKTSNEIIGARQVHRMKEVLAFCAKIEVYDVDDDDDDDDVEIVFETR